MQELFYARTSIPTYIQKEKQRGATSMTHFKTRSAKIDKNSGFKQPGTIAIGKYLSEHSQEKKLLCNQYLNNNTYLEL